MTTITGRMTNWDVTWNGVALGTFFETDAQNLKMVLEPIYRGTTGTKLILGHMVVGLEGTVKIQCADVTASLQTTLKPWQVSGEIIPPTPNSDLYQYAQLLTLHPHDLPALTTSEDINLMKTVPLNVVGIRRDGGKQDMVEVEFQPYPDRAQIIGATPKLIYGYLGPHP